MWQGFGSSLGPRPPGSRGHSLDCYPRDYKCNKTSINQSPATPAHVWMPTGVRARGIAECMLAMPASAHSVLTGGVFQGEFTLRACARRQRPAGGQWAVSGCMRLRQGVTEDRGSSATEETGSRQGPPRRARAPLIAAESGRSSLGVTGRCRRCLRPLIQGLCPRPRPPQRNTTAPLFQPNLRSHGQITRRRQDAYQAHGRAPPSGAQRR